MMLFFELLSLQDSENVHRFVVCTLSMGSTLYASSAVLQQHDNRNETPRETSQEHGRRSLVKGVEELDNIGKKNEWCGH